MKDEITAANEMLEEYGFRFFDLTECSPQQDKTRRECAKAARYMLDQYPPELIEELVRKNKCRILIKAIVSRNSRTAIFSKTNRHRTVG